MLLKYTKCEQTTQPQEMKAKGGRRVRVFLIEARKNKRLNQKDAATAVGISQTAYCNIEKGKRNPSIKVAKRIAEEFGFEWTRFFEEKS